VRWVQTTEEAIFRVNGRAVRFLVDPGETLLHVVRESLGLTGPKAGCENGDCGACTMLLDGVPVKSCMIPAIECVGKDILTVEGLDDPGLLEAFSEESSFQCGFCASGFLVNIYALVRAFDDPDEEIIKEWLSSNLCRCTGYAGIRRGLERYIQIKSKGS